MPLTIIKGNPEFIRDFDELNNEPFLEVAEFFADTIQGENFVGYPAAFLRLQHCTQNCVWCDTQEVWRYGNPYTYNELFEMMEGADLIRKFKEGQHLILTGGSPLKQQHQLTGFINAFITKYGFKPYIEVENECSLMPTDKFCSLVDLWNNSPKLANSGSTRYLRYQPTILKKMASLPNSWFKFVVSEEIEWEEIKTDFIDTGLIRKDQIVLMPLGATREELISNRQKVLDIAIRENVRYTTREHVIIWDKKTGV